MALIGGLWQSVWLEKRSSAHIDGLRLTPDVATSSLAVETTIAGVPAGGALLRLTVHDPDGTEVAADDVAVSAAGMIATDALRHRPGRDPPVESGLTGALFGDRSTHCCRRHR